MKSSMPSGAWVGQTVSKRARREMSGAGERGRIRLRRHRWAITAERKKTDWVGERGMEIEKRQGGTERWQRIYFSDEKWKARREQAKAKSDKWNRLMMWVVATVVTEGEAKDTDSVFLWISQLPLSCSDTWNITAISFFRNLSSCR